MQAVRIGVIGLGNMGRFHASYLANGEVRGASLAGVADANPDRLKDYHSVAAFTHHEDLISSGVVDAVIIATPHFFHTAIGVNALTHGLHVLVEKPIAVDKASAQRLIDAHTDSSIILATMLNQRVLVGRAVASS
jgi:predicted dehydrogenase